MDPVQYNLPLDQFYRELDWPSLPEELCNELMEYYSPDDVENIYARPMHKDDQNPHIKSVTYQMHTLVHQQVFDWIKSNLNFPDDYIISIQKIKYGLTPHKDYYRNSSYNFLVTKDAGTITRWHSKTGMKTIHEVQYKPRKWYHHQSRVMHSVELEDPKVNRVAITVFKAEEMPGWRPDSHNPELRGNNPSDSRLRR
jgi:hypothetical protein